VAESEGSGRNQTGAAKELPKKRRPKSPENLTHESRKGTIFNGGWWDEVRKRSQGGAEWALQFVCVFRDRKKSSLKLRILITGATAGRPWPNSENSRRQGALTEGTEEKEIKNNRWRKEMPLLIRKFEEQSEDC